MYYYYHYYYHYHNHYCYHFFILLFEQFSAQPTMKTAVFFVLTVALTVCRCTPVETFDIADNADIGETTDIADITDITDFDPEEEVGRYFVLFDPLLDDKI